MNEKEIDNSDNEPFFIIKGKEYCNEEFCLAELLRDNVLFCNERYYVEYEYEKEKRADGRYHKIEDKFKIQAATTVLFVNCNDTFWWATGDAEPLPNDEIGNLYRMWKNPDNKGFGVTKWCCLQRGLQPQAPLKKMLQDAGVWDSRMESLEGPGPS